MQEENKQSVALISARRFLRFNIPILFFLTYLFTLILIGDLDPIGGLILTPIFTLVSLILSLYSIKRAYYAYCVYRIMQDQKQKDRALNLIRVNSVIIVSIVIVLFTFGRGIPQLLYLAILNLFQ